MCSSRSSIKYAAHSSNNRSFRVRLMLVRSPPPTAISTSRSRRRRWQRGGGARPVFGLFASVLGRAHIAEQEARYLPLLDLLAALGDAIAAVMAIDVLERLMPRIAHAAMHLHGLIGGLAAEPVCPVIAHRDLVRERVLDLRLRELIHLPGGLADQKP